MSEIKVEFAVQMSGPRCVEKVRKALDGLGDVQINSDLGRVIIETNVPWCQLQECIEKTGRKAVLSGFGGQSAVAMVGDGHESIKGVVRFSAIDTKSDGCVVDGVIDGLSPGLHGMHVHECGDISEGCESVGDHYNPRSTPHGAPNDPGYSRHAGDLGNIRAADDGRATFRFIDPILNVGEIIGRSVVITENEDDFGKSGHERSPVDGNSGRRLACGIIARSAGILQNYKKICACDGVTLWDERDKPLAGGNRSINTSSSKNGKREVHVNVKEVRCKIYNLTQRYGDEKKRLATGSSPPTWRYYNGVHAIIGAYTYNDVAPEDSLMTNEDDALYSAPDSPPMFSSTTIDHGVLSEDVSIGLQYNSVSRATRHPGTSSSSSAVIAPSSPSSAVVEPLSVSSTVAGPSSTMTGPSSPAAGPSSSISARRRKNTAYRVQTKMLAEMQRGTDAFIRERAEHRKAAQEQMQLEKVFVESTMKFQTDLMDFLMNNKK